MRQRDIGGRVVVITGGARGIGATTGRVLAGRGAVVVLADRDGAEAERTAAGLGSTASGHQLDVTDHPAFSGLLDRVVQTHGRLDVLINNAGIMPLTGVTEEPPEVTRMQLEINLHAVIHGTREAVARMRPIGSGHIVNIASAAGKFGFASGSTYCATKFGVVGFSEAVRVELRGTGIEVSCVIPGMVRTELISGLEELPVLKPVTPEHVAEAIASALGRPRFEVFVPRRLNAMTRAQRLVPQRAGDWAFRRLRADQALVHGAASPEREEYQARTTADRSE